MAPAVSVITVVRNDAAGLALTRASLIAQDWRDFEWLVADGGSTDGTAELLAGWAGEMGWWDSKPDAGPFDAMNRAMEQARGEWLLFLNAGDRLADSKALSALAAAREHADLVYGDAVEEVAPGLTAIRPARRPRWAFYGMFAHHCAILYRHDQVRGLRYRTDLRIAADYGFTLEALRSARTCVHVSRPVACFASGGRSRTEERLGREEQFQLRRWTLCMPLAVCLSIRIIQFGMGSLRRFWPKFYGRLRFTSTFGP
ncbi:glycosyltransferase family 2 protein [Indioceanicola profundi]|uniref:glycosyltransferase family 2 protein n=1 Tax=Indioceanicola profundi TaxID=2220096 RepID=UPI000E6A9580|nr:glycosyltransferase family 2 protein [Indioceanicola profundi]